MKSTRVFNIITVFLGIAFFSSCAFDDGNPWGWVNTDLTIESVPPSAEVSLDSQSAIVESIRLLVPGESAGGVPDFDPSDPPPGYSLCHNGHCHADDGSLVDYEDIIAGTGGAASGPTAIVTRQIQSDFDLTTRIEERLKIVEQTQITEVEVLIERLNLSGTLNDGRRLEVSLNLRNSPLEAPIRYDVGRYEPEEQELTIVLSWPADLFDGLGFDGAATDDDGDLIQIHGGRNRTLYDELISRIQADAHLQWIEE